MSLCRQDISIEKVMGKMLDFGEEDWVIMTYLVLDLRSGSSFFCQTINTLPTRIALDLGKYVFIQP